MNKTKWTLAIAAVLTVAMLLGVTLSTAIAKPPKLGTYKCISGDYYLCTAVSTNPLVECCELVSSGCDQCQENWWWYTDGQGNTYTCTEQYGGGTCVLHNCN